MMRAVVAVGEGRSCRAVAKDFGIHYVTVYRYCKKAKSQSGPANKIHVR